MVFKYQLVTLKITFWFTIAIIITGCRCTPDIYGDNILLEVPIVIQLNADTLSSGDTIWISADFSKDVIEKKSGSPIFLDNFQFFTTIGISEISDTIERYPSISITEQVGSVSQLMVPTAVAYPISYEESETKYEFKAGIIVPEQPGLYSIGLSSSNLLFEEYDHPAMFQCGNDHRSVVNVNYKNDFTTRENYENIYRNTRVDYLLELISFENFQAGGAVAFYVR